MDFPEDKVLIARGQYSTLGKARREQLERVQSVCTAIVTAAHAALRDCEVLPPVNLGPIQTLEKCMENLKDARGKVVSLASEMIAIKKVAWPE